MEYWWLGTHRIGKIDCESPNAGRAGYINVCDECSKNRSVLTTQGSEGAVVGRKVLCASRCFLSACRLIRAVLADVGYKCLRGQGANRRLRFQLSRLRALSTSPSCATWRSTIFRFQLSRLRALSTPVRGGRKRTTTGPISALSPPGVEHKLTQQRLTKTTRPISALSPPGVEHSRRQRRTDTSAAPISALSPPGVEHN